MLKGLVARPPLGRTKTELWRVPLRMPQALVPDLA